MPRRTKLDFKPLSLNETAKELGVPRARALKIFALIGVKSNGMIAGPLRTNGKARTAKVSSRGPKKLAR